MGQIAKNIWRVIYNDRVSLYSLGFGVGWTACNLTHNGFDFVLPNIACTIICVWASTLMNRASPAQPTDGGGK
jgi:hypothetical protein